MTTAQQVKRLIEPFLARHNDLARVGGCIMLKPVRHVLRGVLIERTSYANSFQPSWAVCHLCEPRGWFTSTWSDRFFRGSGLGWYWDDPLMPADLYRVLEEEALPFLRGIDTLDDFVAVTARDRFPLSSLEAFALEKIKVDVARGDLDSARKLCAKLRTGRTMWSAPEFRESFSRVVDRLCPLLATDDRPAMVQLLSEWETYTVENLRIEAIWEPTPFPLELQHAAE